MLKTKSGIFLFNIIPSYRPGMGKVFDHGYYDLACTPSLAQRSKQNTLYTSLENIAGESLSDLDLLYIMATDGTGTFAKINWVSPGDFQAVEHGTVTFTENEGITGDGSTGYWDTGWNPDADGVNFTLDEGGAFVWVNNEISTGNKYQFGVDRVASDTVALSAKAGSTQCRYGVNSSTVIGSNAGTSVGFYHVRRVADNDLKLFKDSTQIATTTQASSSLSDLGITLTILAFNANGTVAGHSDSQIGIFGLGASLTGQESALYTAWNTYFSSL